MSGRWIPNVLTIVNILAGLGAVRMTFSGHILYAALLILAAVMFDSIEGRIVRRLNAVSVFGRKFDCLADLTVFGIAPVIMAYWTSFSQLGLSTLPLMVLFPGSGIIRQTRIDAASLQGYYTGLPLSVAGLILAGTSVIGESLPYECTAIILVVLSGLMLSTIKIRRL